MSVATHSLQGRIYLGPGSPRIHLLRQPTRRPFKSTSKAPRGLRVLQCSVGGNGPSCGLIRNLASPLRSLLGPALLIVQTASPQLPPFVSLLFNSELCSRGKRTTLCVNASCQAFPPGVGSAMLEWLLLSLHPMLLGVSTWVALRGAHRRGGH